MEDCCAVCAEPLEWIGYGPCGHREVCFTCVARLRLVLKDDRCCICKQHCPTVYITKALGDYTTVVTDWKPLLNETDSSRQGGLLYDKEVQAYFDDEEPFKIIQAMCRLSCNTCERAEKGGEAAKTKGMVKRGYTFKSVDALRRHELNVHDLFMCGLCLEGRKVFISEQKLYTTSQLHQHLRKGNPEVDGYEAFAGHPSCAFCRKRFYGDNELYQHMSQDHYTCYICQRARPGHFEYYHTYDDLEAHFGQRHWLCENPECLAEKFVVFPSESALKRHNASRHGGHMSRSQRNSALQIPVSFGYRRSGQDSLASTGGEFSSRRGGRGRDTGTENVDVAVPAIFESAYHESIEISRNSYDSEVMDTRDPVERPSTNSLDRGIAQSQQHVEIGPSRYLAAVGGGSGRGTPSAVDDAAFPPLPETSRRASREVRAENQGSASIMAALLSNGSRSARAGIRVLNKAGYRSSSVPA